MNDTIDRYLLHSRSLHWFLLLLLLSVGSASAQEDPNGFIQTNGPTGGLFRNIVSTPDGDLFAGYVFGVIYRSRDGGTSWQETGGPVVPRLFNLHAHPNGSLFAVGATATSSMTWSIHRSTDDGESWETVMPPVDIITSMAMGQNDDVYALSFNDSLAYRSSDNGESWDTLATPVKGYLLSISDGGALYLLGVNPDQRFQAFRSTDRGETWEPWGDTFGTEYSISTGESKPMVVTPSGDLFLGVARSVGVLHLDTLEKTWEEANEGLLPNGSINTIRAVGPDTLMASGDAGVYLSPDRGESWAPLGTFTGENQVASVIMTDDGSVVAALEFGIYRYDPLNDEWRSTSQGILRSNIITIASGRDTTYATFSSLYRTVDGGNEWELVPLPLQNDESAWVVSVGSNGRVFVGANSYTNGPHGGLVNTKGSVYRSVDGGENWERKNVGLNATSITRISIDGDLIFVSSDSGLFRSSDDGDSWTHLTDGNLRGMRTNCAIVAANGDLLVGTQTSGIWRSSDNGENWVESNTGNQNSRCSTLAMSPNGTLFTTGGNGSSGYRSTDNGLTWQRMENGLPVGGDLWNVVAMPQGTLFISGDNNIGVDPNLVWRSNDDGLTWEALDTLASLPRTLSVDSAGYVYAGTSSRAVLRSASSLTSGVEERTDATSGLDLVVRHGDESLVLTFTLPGASTVLCELYDRSGRLVAAATARLSAGEQSEIMSTASLPSGWYAVRLVAGDAEAIRPILITR